MKSRPAVAQSMRTDGRTDMTKLIVASRSLANASENIAAEDTFRSRHTLYFSMNMWFSFAFFVHKRQVKRLVRAGVLHSQLVRK